MATEKQITGALEEIARDFIGEEKPDILWNLTLVQLLVRFQRYQARLNPRAVDPLMVLVMENKRVRDAAADFNFEYDPKEEG